MRVVEIGCGDQAGPRFADADEQYAVDEIAWAVRQSVEEEPGLLPLVANATCMPVFGEASVDVMLARNVFGDPYLGLLGQADMLEVLVANDADDRREQAARRSDIRKQQILDEAARILVDNGQLIIVEQYTPEYARQFLRSIIIGELSRSPDLALPKAVRLSDVASTNYAAKHGRQEHWPIWSLRRIPR